MSEDRSINLSEKPLSALRASLLVESDPATPAELRALRADPRAGAQQLARQILARRSRLRDEAERLRWLFRRERDAWSRGVRLVAGADEVGMGPLAGPVVAAAVVLPSDRAAELDGLNDSKKLSAARRRDLDQMIRERATAYGIGSASRREIDQINIYQAGLLALRRAVMNLDPAPELVYVDARTIPSLAIKQHAVLRGDAEVGSIAAASIVAKVHRDALMEWLDTQYPGYGFADHRGYGTPDHLEALRRRGPSPEHRRSFAPVREAEELGPCPTS